MVELFGRIWCRHRYKKWELESSGWYYEVRQCGKCGRVKGVERV